MSSCAKLLYLSGQCIDLLNSCNFLKNLDSIYLHDSLINQFTMILNFYNDSTSNRKSPAIENHRFTSLPIYSYIL